MLQLQRLSTDKTAASGKEMGLDLSIRILNRKKLKLGLGLFVANYRRNNIHSQIVQAQKQNS